MRSSGSVLVCRLLCLLTTDEYCLASIASGVRAKNLSPRKGLMDDAENESFLLASFLHVSFLYWSIAQIAPLVQYLEGEFPMDRFLVGSLLLILGLSGCRMSDNGCDYLPPVLDGPYSPAQSRVGSGAGEYGGPPTLEEPVIPAPQELPQREESESPVDSLELP